jgi:hypothetical protein
LVRAKRPAVKRAILFVVLLVAVWFFLPVLLGLIFGTCCGPLGGGA